MLAGTHSSPGSPHSEQLRCKVVSDADRARLCLTGALDLATVPVLQAALDDVAAAGARQVILDLSELEFMDSSGLHCVLRLAAAARQDGFSLALVRGPSSVQRVFEVTGTADVLPFTDARPGDG